MSILEFEFLQGELYIDTEDSTCKSAYSNNKFIPCEFFSISSRYTIRELVLVSLSNGEEFVTGMYGTTMFYRGKTPSSKIIKQLSTEEFQSFMCMLELTR